ncbi:hypothetical protein ACIQC7_35160 [Kitasatospora sp. NPDC088556]|uniref:hypothetical protein n=1 Tax=Kitasatospora sp. NPDC088556 TaxID=3364076 RepID=UPI0038102A3B
MIKRGQIYQSLSGRHHPADRPTRILIKGVIPYGAGCWGQGTASVVTLTTTGREVRPRNVKLTQLHNSATTRDGQPRRTGYRLVRDAE